MTERIEINLDRENVYSKAIAEKEEFSKWLSGNNRSFTRIELDIKERGGNIDNVLMGLATMGIEIDAAVEYSKKGETEKATCILLHSIDTKDFIYNQLMRVYGTANGNGKILSLNFQENLKLCGDYVMQKYDRGLKAVQTFINKPN